MQKKFSLAFLWIYMISALELQRNAVDKRKLPDFEKRVFCNAFTGCGSYHAKRSQSLGSSKNSAYIKRSHPDALFFNLLDVLPVYEKEYFKR
ncbi:hypothetical protein HNY73_005706 [Argiope bruennichi]|uniref:Uncharacterized protein n=1 Tax=Argiope bruennichi TaxID=94029 RepID=A0A8T0FMU2_ARGBR|nr:hypothetical protein HNY73_005706 [Argiope bruennichi]